MDSSKIMPSLRTFRIMTFGCKVNQYESELLREQFIEYGLREVRGDDPAELYVVNTCTVTGQADAKCRKTIRHIAKHNPESKIIVTGCYAERDRDTLSNLPNVDAVISNQGKDNLVAEVLGIPRGNAHHKTLITSFEEHTRAFIKIQDGCNEFCSYCIIPYVRGKPLSRDIKEILEESKGLVAHGYKEIVLTGIHVGCFGRTENKIHNLPELVRQLEMVDGLHRLRISSIDPNEVNDELISAINSSSVACSHLHISLQSGSTRILELMRRKYSADDYLRLTEKLYNQFTDISISTDIMVGFPGETDDDFNESRKLVEKVEFSKVHIFPFSPREGTAAIDLPDPVDPVISHERGAVLASAAGKVAESHRKNFVGRNMVVLIERKTGEGNRYEGFTDNYLRTIIESEQPLHKNEFIKARITDFDPKYLYAEVLT